jgi:hypothetical protein
VIFMSAMFSPFKLAFKFIHITYYYNIEFFFLTLSTLDVFYFLITQIFSFFNILVYTLFYLDSNALQFYFLMNFKLINFLETL